MRLRLNSSHLTRETKRTLRLLAPFWTVEQLRSSAVPPSSILPLFPAAAFSLIFSTKPAAWGSRKVAHSMSFCGPTSRTTCTKKPLSSPGQAPRAPQRRFAPLGSVSGPRRSSCGRTPARAGCTRPAVQLGVGAQVLTTDGVQVVRLAQDAGLAKVGSICRGEGHGERSHPAAASATTHSRVASPSLFAIASRAISCTIRACSPTRSASKPSPARISIGNVRYSFSTLPALLTTTLILGRFLSRTTRPIRYLYGSASVQRLRRATCPALGNPLSTFSPARHRLKKRLKNARNNEVIP